MSDGLQTPFSNPVMSTPSGEASGGVAVSGGADLPDGRKETPNMGDLPLAPTLYEIGGVGPSTQAPMPPASSPGTIPSGSNVPE